jgi:hypothetical protein
MYYHKDTKFIHSSEEFIKECIALPSNNIVLAITHDYGQIEVEFVPATMLLSGSVYTLINEETEKFVRLDYKDIAHDNGSALLLSSALYTYLAEAYRIASILERTLIQKRY